jgi:hypothetical protein
MKKALRLRDKLSQIVHTSYGKASIVDVKHVYSHSNGILSGLTTISGKPTKVQSFGNEWKVVNG